MRVCLCVRARESTPPVFRFRSNFESYSSRAIEKHFDRVSHPAVDKYLHLWLCGFNSCIFFQLSYCHFVWFLYCGILLYSGWHIRGSFSLHIVIHTCSLIISLFVTESATPFVEVVNSVIVLCYYCHFFFIFYCCFH